MHRQDIPKVVKYSYLKGVLRGSAASVVTGVSVTNDGYDVAIRILHERFGNKEAIIEALYAKLQHLPTASNKFSDIKYTYDVIEKLLRQLESQGEIVNQQKMLIHQLLSKFPLEVIVKLEDVKKCDQVWTMQLLRKLLSQYVMVQENAQRRVNNVRGGSLQGRQVNRSPTNRDTLIIRRLISHLWRPLLLMYKRKLKVLHVTHVCFVGVSILMMNVNNTSH